MYYDTLYINDMFLYTCKTKVMINIYTNRILYNALQEYVRYDGMYVQCIEE